MNETQISKREEYLLKKERKEKERIQGIRKRKIKRIIFISLPLVFVVGLIIFAIMNYSPEKKEEIAGAPKIEIIPLEYDVGTVSMNQGLVKRNYEIKNTGSGSLKIDNIWTSCACTAAYLKTGEKTSPEFGMPGHGANPIFWSEIINPGETASLEVIFDPAFHGSQGLGENVRAVYLSTNDPENKTAEARLSANVVD